MICPDCGRLMHRAGYAWSGRRRVQRWRCAGCGRTTTIKTEPAGKEVIGSGKG